MVVSDEHFELCLPILQDPCLDDEARTDKLEEIFRKETSLTGPSLENTILDVLWRHKEGDSISASPPAIRHHALLRRTSPAPWRASPIPVSSSPRLAVSPLAPPGYTPMSFPRAVSSTALSPFSSPRPSPRMAVASPALQAYSPNSPNLQPYDFAHPLDRPSHSTDLHDVADWLLSDDTISIASSVGTTSSLNAAAPEFSAFVTSSDTSPQTTANHNPTSPYDVVRSILGQYRTDEEIEKALESHSFDLGAAIQILMTSDTADDSASGSDSSASLLFTKPTSDVSHNSRPSTPAGPAKPGVLCKFFLSTGQCLRADCRYSHDPSTHICKYWFMGNCLAGDSCIFSHDPTQVMARLSLEQQSQQNNTSLSQTNSPQHRTISRSPQAHDNSAFPPLRPSTPNKGIFAKNGSPLHPGKRNQSPRDHHHNNRSRPVSRQQSSSNLSVASRNQSPLHPSRAKDRAVTDHGAIPLDDAEAFPTLGAAAATGKGGKRQGRKQPTSNNLNSNNNSANPSPTFGKVDLDLGLDVGSDSVTSSPKPDSIKMEKSASARSTMKLVDNDPTESLTEPELPPWLIHDVLNQAYLAAHQEAIKHGIQRNKSLQSAAQAWHRNDARAAKALSLRGQSENDLMKKAHREAARALYEQRDCTNPSRAEVFVDLNGLHVNEAVEYLDRVLGENRHEQRPFYVITGTSHQGKNGKDRIAKAVRIFLQEWGYTFREFAVAIDRTGGSCLTGNHNASHELIIGVNLQMAPAREASHYTSEPDHSLVSSSSASTISAISRTDPSMTGGDAVSNNNLQIPVEMEKKVVKRQLSSSSSLTSAITAEIRSSHV